VLAHRCSALRQRCPGPRQSEQQNARSLACSRGAPRSGSLAIRRSALAQRFAGRGRFQRQLGRQSTLRPPGCPWSTRAALSQTDRGDRSGASLMAYLPLGAQPVKQGLCLQTNPISSIYPPQRRTSCSRKLSCCRSASSCRLSSAAAAAPPPPPPPPPLPPLVAAASSRACRAGTRSASAGTRGALDARPHRTMLLVNSQQSVLAHWR